MASDSNCPVIPGKSIWDGSGRSWQQPSPSHRHCPAAQLGQLQPLCNPSPRLGSHLAPAGTCRAAGQHKHPLPIPSRIPPLSGGVLAGSFGKGRLCVSPGQPARLCHQILRAHTEPRAWYKDTTARVQRQEPHTLLRSSHGARLPWKAQLHEWSESHLESPRGLGRHGETNHTRGK